MPTHLKTIITHTQTNRNGETNLDIQTHFDRKYVENNQWERKSEAQTIKER